MPRLIIASTNPVKIDAASRGFQQMFPGEVVSAMGISVPSGGSDQPMTSAETRQGALNRANNARAAQPDSDYWVGIEGGAEDTDYGLSVFAWIIVLSSERMGQAQTGVFMLPHAVADLVRAGVELGLADDRVFGRENSKQDNGAVGLLTNDVIDRADYYTHAMILALIPFRRSDLEF